MIGLDRDVRRSRRHGRSPWGSLSALVVCCALWQSPLALAQRPFPGAPSAGEIPSAERPVPTDSKIDVPLRTTERKPRVNLGLQGVNPGGDSAVEPASFSVEELLHEPLADVVVEGNDTIRTDAILRQIQCRPGRPASSRMIQQDVTQLLNTRWFFTVRPKYRSTDTGPVLVFQVVERPILRKVTFNGNKKIKTAELQAHTGLRENAPYDVAANRESVHRIRQLYKDKGYRFADVLLVKGDSPDDREVIFDIIEGPKPKIWDIDFVGNKFCSSGILRTKISSKTVKLWIIQGDYDPDLIRNDVLALKQYYMGLGFFDVDVQSEDVLSEDKSKVTLTFHITEGHRYKVEGIEVVGNEVIPRERLLKELKLEPGDYFNERFLKEDVSTMTEMYDEQGRLFAKVVPTPRFRDGEEPLVDLVYEIDEDVPRYIGMINVHIRGDYPHSQEEVVIQQVNRFLKPGRLARSFDLRMAQARVTGSGIWDKQEAPSFDIVPNDGIDYWPHVANRGQDISGIIQQVYKEPSDIPDVLAADAPDDVFGHSLAPLALPARQQAASVRARPQEQLPETAVTTLPALPPPAGRKEISQPRPQTEPPAPNVVIDPELVFRGQSPPDFNYRSQSLDAYGLPVPQDFLQRVSPQGDPYGDALSVPPPGFVDVNIDVSEGRTGRLMFGVGVNSDAGLIGSLVLQEDNFNLLRPPTSWEDVLNGQAWRGAGQSLRLEAVPGTQVSRYMATWQDPYFLRSDFSLGLSGYYFNRYYESWTETRMGGRASLGYVLDRYWSTSASLRLEDVEITDVPAGAPTDLTSVAGSNFLSTGSVGLAYDARDNSFFPTRGNYVNLTYEQAFGDFNYPKADLTASQYFTTYERPDGFGKHILSFTGQVGFTGNQTPIFERFFAGGYSSFRGFYFRGVSPVQNGYRVGGDFMLLGSAEYMVPLTANDNIRAVVFSDFGTVEPDVRLDDFRLTAGFGFRVTIPAMGPAPLAFDFAWPIMKEDYDRLRVFSFYVGFTR